MLIPEFAIHLLSHCKIKEGPIIQTSIPKFNETWDKLRELAGFLKLDNQGNKVWNTWSHDVARHTGATMHYGIYQSKKLAIS